MTNESKQLHSYTNCKNYFTRENKFPSRYKSANIQKQQHNHTSKRWHWIAWFDTDVYVHMNLVYLLIWLIFKDCNTDVISKYFSSSKFYSIFQMIFFVIFHCYNINGLLDLVSPQWSWASLSLQDYGKSRSSHIKNFLSNRKKNKKKIYLGRLLDRTKLKIYIYIFKPSEMLDPYDDSLRR